MNIYVIQKNVSPFYQTDITIYLDSQTIDRHTGGTWLVHGSNHRQNQHSQDLNAPAENPTCNW